MLELIGFICLIAVISWVLEGIGLLVYGIVGCIVHSMAKRGAARRAEYERAVFGVPVEAEDPLWNRWNDGY